MKCPACEQEINRVEITVQCRIDGKLKGNRVVDQEPLGYIHDSAEIKCPKCRINITFAIEEIEI